MKQTLFIKNGLTVNLDFEIQISPSNRPFRLSGTELLPNFGTIHTFRYMDVPCEFFAFEFDRFNNFVKKVTLQ